MTLSETDKAVDFFGIVRGTEDGVVAVGPDLRVVGWNQGATRILGYSREDALGRLCHQVFRGYDRCGNLICGEDCPALGGLRHGDLVPTRDLLARDRSGRKVWLSLTTMVPPREYRDVCLFVHIFREMALPPELERFVAERIRGADQPGQYRPGLPLGADQLGRGWLGSLAGAEAGRPGAAAPGPGGPGAGGPGDGGPGAGGPGAGGPGGPGRGGSGAGRRSALDALSAREREVLRLLAEGAGTRDIARRLYISPATARNHIQHILGRLEVGSRLQAVALALREPSWASELSRARETPSTRQ